MRDTQRETQRQGKSRKPTEIGEAQGTRPGGAAGADVGEGGGVGSTGGPSSIIHQASENLCSMAGPSLMDRIEQERSDWVPQLTDEELNHIGSRPSVGKTVGPGCVKVTLELTDIGDLDQTDPVHEKKGAAAVDGALEHEGPVVDSEKKAAAPEVKPVERTRMVTAKALAEVLRFRQGPVIQAIEKNGGARDAQGVLWAAWECRAAIGKELHLNLGVMNVMWLRAETWSKKLPAGLEMVKVVQITGRNNVLGCEILGGENRGQRTTAICRDVLLHEMQQEVVTRVGTFSREVWYGSL